MADIFSEVDELFGSEQVPTDGTGCLRTAAQCLGGIEVSFLLLAGCKGRLIAVDDAGSAGDLGEARRVALFLAENLADKALRTFRYPTPSGQNLCFGLRLPAETEGVILGGLLVNSDSAAQRLESMYPALAACGSLVWFSVHAGSQAAEQARRIEHLLAEQETLKQAHAHIVATVIEEREQRICEQRDYVVHLEEAVQKRSTALREAMKKAKEANEAKSTFLANMSHEIRTPMTAILGYADVLFESCDIGQAPPLRVEAIETIRRNGQHLLELINDILDIAKVEAGKLVIEQVCCSPVELMTDVMRLTRVRAEEQGLALDVEYEGPIPALIRTDPMRLRQILTNLVGNAIKFTEEGEIKVVARMKQGGAGGDVLMQFDVIDTGIGLSGPHMACLFQPFSQADPSTTRRYGGTGLGLALSRRLAQELGGDISVTSRLGEGSTFRLTVAIGPLEGVEMIHDPMSAATIAPVTETASADPADLQDCRILLAEDAMANQRLIAHVLKKAGAEVTVQVNGKLAVEAALTARDEGNPFDVILMDMQMPVMDGYEATGLLRQKGYTCPIIALTAHAMATDREKCLNAGCDEYASKPIDRKKLIETIRQQIESRAATKGAL